MTLLLQPKLSVLPTSPGPQPVAPSLSPLLKRIRTGMRLHNLNEIAGGIFPAEADS